MFNIRMMKRILFVLFLLPFMGWAGPIKFSTSTDKKSYYDFERIYLTYKVENANYEGIELPKSTEFDVVNKRISSSSSSFIIIQNGKRISQGDEIYEVIFELKPKKKGTIHIPQGVLKVDGKTYTSAAFTVEVKEMKVNVDQAGKDRFVNVEVSNSSPYVGQSFTITYTLYTVDQITEGSQFKNPEAFINFGPFTVKELSRLNGSQVNLKGKVYSVVEFQTHLLTPVKAETVTIPSFKIDYTAYKYYRQSWFETRREEVPYSVAAPKVTIKVKALPAPPANFSGLVGRFQSKLKLDKKSLQVNDALTAKYEITGSGNFMALEELPLEWGGVWEVFDPKINDAYQAGSKGYSGKKTFEYVAIPRQGGKYKLPVVDLSYFDLDSKKYLPLKFDVPEIIVEGGTNSNSSAMTAAVVGKKVKAETNDIRYLKTNFELSESKPFDLLASKWFYGFTGLNVAGLFYLMLFYKPKKYAQEELVSAKQKKAAKKAREILKGAELALHGEEKVFYAKVESALNQFLMDKYVINPADFSQDNVIQKLQQAGVSAGVIEKVVQTQNRCNMARYSPIGVNKEQVYKEVTELLVELQ